MVLLVKNISRASRFLKQIISTFVEVKSYLKPRIIKLPNKTSYNMNENLDLLCEFFDMQSNIYSNFKILKHYYFLFWEKDGRKIKRSETKQKLVLGPMTSEKEGIYKCVIQRKDIYSKSSPMIKIKLKGIIFLHDFYYIDLYICLKTSICLNICV